MNYLALKNLIDTITKTYKCPECWEEVDESAVDIMWAAWNTINIDIECNHCWKHSIMKAEVAYLWSNVITKDFIEKIKSSIWKKNKKDLLKDKDIIELNNKLKKQKINIEDLF
jgi:DNA-directed RNA polymerase subunit RPC12/RpoP